MGRGSRIVSEQPAPLIDHQSCVPAGSSRFSNSTPGANGRPAESRRPVVFSFSFQFAVYLSKGDIDRVPVLREQHLQQLDSALVGVPDKLDLSPRRGQLRARLSLNRVAIGASER